MNYRSIQIKAVVDWVDIQIETQNSTNFQTVQRAFAAAISAYSSLNLFVKSIDANDGGGAHRFVVQLHDVKTYSEIEQKLIAVGGKLSLKPGFEIVKIELAIDAYCDNLADQAANFYKFMANPVSNNRRMYRDPKAGKLLSATRPTSDTNTSTLKTPTPSTESGKQSKLQRQRQSRSSSL